MTDHISSIARSALNVERQRMAIIAQNLANAGTTAATYVPKRLISGPGVATAPFASMMRGGRSAAFSLAGVRSYGVETLNVEPRRVHDPGHPSADGEGNVSYPGVDHAGEMALLIQTQRIYEANVIMCNAARSMAMRAMDIGGKA